MSKNSKRGGSSGRPDVPPDVKIVRKTLADGTEKLYFYHRATGKPIDAEPGTVAFMVAYAEAGKATPEPQGGGNDLEALIDRYMASPEWRELSKATQETRRSYFKKIKARFAGTPIAFLNKEEIVGVLYDWRDELAADISPYSADKAMDALRVVLTWAKKRRMIKINWAAEVERLVPLSRSRSKLVWTPELWAPLYAAARPDERTLLDFATYTAAREGDIPQMKWEQFDGKWLVYTPSKTARSSGVEVHLPVYALPPFARLMDELPRASDHILVTDTGQPWTTSNIKLRMRSLKARAFPDGNPGRTFHDIRGTTISRLYNAGCTDAEVASVDGHAIGQGTNLGRYAERSRQLAINAYQRWAAFEFAPSAEVVPFKRA